MNNEKPTKAQEKAWLQRVSEYGCVVTEQSNIQIHHCIGREGKHNKFHIGRWFVLPLAFELHDVSSNNEYNITHHRKAFIEKYGSESELFMAMCVVMSGALPFEHDVFQTILATNR